MLRERAGGLVNCGVVFLRWFVTLTWLGALRPYPFWDWDFGSVYVKGEKEGSVMWGGRVTDWIFVYRGVRMLERCWRKSEAVASLSGASFVCTLSVSLAHFDPQTSSHVVGLAGLIRRTRWSE